MSKSVYTNVKTQPYSDAQTDLVDKAIGERPAIGVDALTPVGFPAIAADALWAAFAPAAGTAVSSGAGQTVTASQHALTSSASPAAFVASAWISQIQTQSVAADMTAACASGSLTYDGLFKLVNNLDLRLKSTSTTLSATQLADLKIIAANLNNGVTTSSYLTSIMNALVTANKMNTTYTGGGTSSTYLGNLAAGSSATQLSNLIGKWFLGADLPNAQVIENGSRFSISYSNASGPLFGANGPSINDVNQGQLGDCYLLAGLAEVAYQNPTAITSMITDNGNNAYGVRFYINGAASYVTVNTSLANGGGIFNSGTNIWASLVEKAYAQLQTAGAITGNSSINFGNAWSTIGNGGNPVYALEEITGAGALTQFQSNGSSWTNVTYNSSLSITSSQNGKSLADAQTALIADLAAGYDVVLSSYTNARDSYGKTTLVANHAMSIYGYDAATSMFEIRNPWGTAAKQTWDTTFEVSISTLLASHDVITIANIGSPTVTAAASALTSQSAQTAASTLTHAIAGLAPAHSASTMTNLIHSVEGEPNPVFAPKA